MLKEGARIKRAPWESQVPDHYQALMWGWGGRGGEEADLVPGRRSVMAQGGPPHLTDIHFQEGQQLSRKMNNGVLQVTPVGQARIY